MSQRPRNDPGPWADAWEDLGVDEDRARRYTDAGFTPHALIIGYAITKAADGSSAAVRGEDVRNYLAAGVSPERVVTYLDVGVRRSTEVVELVMAGCPPEVFADWNARQAIPRGAWGSTSFFAGMYRGLSKALDGHALGGDYRPTMNAIIQSGVLPETAEVLAWCETGLPAHRIRLLIAAGITPTEALTPTVIATSNEVLGALAALRHGSHRAT